MKENREKKKAVNITMTNKERNEIERKEKEQGRSLSNYIVYLGMNS